jgi:ABC-type branched-subunit amino acid transport system permease subunit
VTVLDLMNFLLPQVEFFGPTVKNFLETGWPILLGLLLLATVLFRPTGLMGFVMRDRSRNFFFGKKDDSVPNEKTDTGVQS